MKKILSLVLALLVLFLAPGCSSSKTATIPVTVEGSIFSGTAGGSLPLTLSFNTAWLTKGDNTCYNKDLAAFGALISADTYFREKDLDKGTQNRVTTGDVPYDPTVLLTRLGFTDVRYIETYKLDELPDPGDSATLTLGYRQEGKDDLFVLALRGCFSAGEWSSCFDPGADTESYKALTGEHPGWTDHAALKGLDIASNRVLALLHDFIEEHRRSDRPVRVLVTGHSRGGAIANLVGARLEDDPAVIGFTYTFNTTGVTSDPKATSYRTVFNIFDQADFFTSIFPFAEEPLYRYGSDVSCEISEYDDLKAEIANLKGTDDYLSLSPEERRTYANLFARRFKNRPALYETEQYSETFEDRRSAEARLQEWVTLIGAEEGLKLAPYCRVGKTEETDAGYKVTLYSCGGALLQGFGRILAYGAAAHDAFTTIFSADKEACAIADFLLEHAAQESAGHRLLNSYCLAGYLKN